MSLLMDTKQVIECINRLVDEKTEEELKTQEKMTKRYELQVPDHRLLTRKEEMFLSFAIQELENLKDEAIDLLIFFNMRLVISFAKDYQTKFKNSDTEELFQEGIIGLITAAKAFDYRRNTRFSTFASYWVKQAIGRYIESTSGSFRLPSNKHALIRQINKATETLEKNNEIVTSENLLQYIKRNFDSKVTQSSFDSVYNKTNMAVSLNTKKNGNIDDDAVEYIDVIEDPTQNINDMVIKSEQDRYIDELLSVLTPLERDVIILTYGLFGIGGDLSLKEIAMLKNISVPSVKYYKSKAFEKLKKHTDLFSE